MDAEPTRDLPPTRPGPDGPPPSTTDHAPDGEVGTRVGPYHLLQRLGEGGMGEVWVAEQSQPVKRRVALKLIKAGMDSARVVARFEAERQALALMDHTNIAKVFDAGTTPAGRPFFVMELVKGVPFTTYCDELHLPIRERLALFVQVCAAVQHAHQKGVIHRDIKPTNVLVAVQDGKPVPKVIDFGVAKALTAKLAEQTMYTEIGAVLGTLEYMAPEQAELSALDVDTRADVYALGALLYELLTGSTPITRERMKTAAFSEVLRLIREEEPPRPSTRLTQSKEALAGLAAKRRTDPGRLAKEVRGELDWIVLKALEKDRTRRYESASGLANDVARFLADEPVEACPPGAGYRVRKFLRRNRVVAGAAAAVLVAVVFAAVGQSVSLMRAWAAEAAARQAEQQATADRTAAEADRDRAARAEAEQAKERAKAEAERDAKQAALTRSDGLRLGAQAMLARPTDPGLGLLLGLEAVRRHPHPVTFSALYDAAADLRERRTVATRLTGIRFLHLGPGGARLLAGAGIADPGAGAAAVYDAGTGSRLAAWHSFGVGLADLDLSRDGTRAAAALDQSAVVTFTDGRKPERATYTDRVAYVWDPATGRDVAHLRGHADKVVSCRFSPDGRAVLTASWDGTARLWDAATGAERHVFRGHSRSLFTAVFSPDGRRVLTVSSQIQRESLYSTASGVPAGGDPNVDPGITTRPWRSHSLYSGTSVRGGGFGEQPLARVWDADTGRQVCGLMRAQGGFTLPPATEEPLAAAFSPDGRRVAVGFAGDVAEVWDTAGDGTKRLTLKGHGDRAAAVAFSPDGKWLATAGSGGVVLLWSVETGKEESRLTGADGVTALRFSRTGPRLLAAAGNAVRVMEVAGSRLVPVATLSGHTAAVTAAHLLDADTAVTAADGTIRYWSLAPPPALATTLAGTPGKGFFALLDSPPDAHSARLTALSFSPDGKSILTGSVDATVRLWDAATGRPKATTDRLRGRVAGAVFSPDGRVYVGTEIDSMNGIRGDKDTLLSMVSRWDPDGGSAERCLKDQRTAVARMTLSPDGRRLAVVGTGTGFRFQPTKTNPLNFEWDFAGPESAAGVWDTATGGLATRLPGSPTFYLGAAPQFSPDGRRVLLPAGPQNELGIYDAATGERRAVLAAPPDPNRYLWAGAGFSPDGRTVAARRTRGAEVWFWDAGTGAPLGAFPVPDGGRGGGESVLCFTPDSKRVVVGADRAVYVVNAATRAAELVLRGHDATVNAVAVSRDGAALVSGSDDRTAIVWHLDSGRVRTVYKGHPGPVTLVAYSPDGTRVATASTDPVARVWPIDLIPEFEKRKPRELTRQERERFDVPAK